MTGKRILELTVLYPAIGLLLLGTIGVVIPHRCHRLNANETAAIATLRNITSAQNQFRFASAVDRDRDGRPEFGTFRELCGNWDLRGDEFSGRLDPPVLSGAFRHIGPTGEVHRSGYWFRIVLPGHEGRPTCPDKPGEGYDAVSADLAERHWCAYAWPVRVTEKQKRLLFVNQDGVILSTPLESDLGRTGPLPGTAFLAGPGGLTGTPAIDTPDRHGRIWTEVD